MPRKQIPDYRLFKPTGAACVDLSGKRFYLGRYGSPRSRERYNWLIGEWIKLGRLQPPKPPAVFLADEASVPQGPIFITVARIAAQYMRHLRRTKPVPGNRFKERVAMGVIGIVLLGDAELARLERLDGVAEALIDLTGFTLNFAAGTSD